MQRTRDSPRRLAAYFSTVRPLLGLVWRASPLLFLASLGLTLLNGLVPAATIFITSGLLERLVTATQSPSSGSDFADDIGWLLVLLGGLAVGAQVLQRLMTMVNQLQGIRVDNQVQLLIAEKAGTIDLAWFEDPAFHNDMRTAANEATYMPKMIVDQLTMSMSSITTLVSLAIVLLAWEAWVVPLILISSMTTLWVATKFGNERVELVNQRAETERKKFYLNQILTSDQAAKEVRLFGLGTYLLENLRGIFDLIFRQDRRLVSRQLVFSGFPAVTMAAVQIAAIALAAYQTFDGRISIGQFSLYMQSVSQMGEQLTALTYMLGSVHEANLFSQKLFRFLSTQPEVEAPRTPVGLQEATISNSPSIEFRNVSFVYPGTEQVVLQDLTFSIHPGETIALVGENGAGKTSLVKLLTGLYEPTTGAISIDGIDIRTLSRDELRSHLGVIFQDHTIYHFTMRENIGFGRVEWLGQFDRIEDAAKRSGLDKIIPALPNGYETVLGRFWEHGHELSGGQRQLVALARALMRDASLLVLDEPSAALDVYAERRFFQELLEHRDDDRCQTVIFISHRFTTVRRADRILVLEHGQLVELGSHEELMRHQGRYAEMFIMQAATYGDSQKFAGIADEGDMLISPIEEQL